MVSVCVGGEGTYFYPWPFVVRWWEHGWCSMVLYVAVVTCPVASVFVSVFCHLRVYGSAVVVDLTKKIHSFRNLFDTLIRPI